MSGADEFTSNKAKSFDWRRLPEGEYKVVNGETVRVDDSEDAATGLASALRKLATTLEKM